VNHGRRGGLRRVTGDASVSSGETESRVGLRARRHVEERRPRFEASREQREELARRFFAASEEGDLEGLEELLAHDVVLRGDGGGKAPALARALHGRARVARTPLRQPELRQAAVARKILIAAWHMLSRNEPFKPAHQGQLRPGKLPLGFGRLTARYGIEKPGQLPPVCIPNAEKEMSIQPSGSTRGGPINQPKT
jgi:hypothetical protein